MHSRLSQDGGQRFLARIAKVREVVTHPGSNSPHGALPRGDPSSQILMGHYKGRVKLTQRRRRFAKNQRIKALAAAQKEPPPPQGTSEQK